MTPRLGWLLTREHPPPGNVQPEMLAVVLTTRKVTNRAVDDLVRELHTRKFGCPWPGDPHWHPVEGGLVMRTADATYKLMRVDVYG